MSANNTKQKKEYIKDSDVLYEDNHLIIVNKKAKQIVQGDKTGDITLADLVKDYIKVKYNKPGEVFLGVSQRLDRPVSGAVIFARTSKALSRINDMLRDKAIKKTYWAIVEEQPPKDSDRLIDYIKKNAEKNKSVLTGKNNKESKEAVLSYTLKSRSDNFFLVEVDLETGRHHQIRAQLANIGCSIKGDLKYGAKRSNKDGSISLHSRKLEFIHPVKKEPVSVTAPVPPKDNLWRHFQEIALDN